VSDYDFSVRELMPVIEDTIKRLPNGDARIFRSKFPLSKMCLAGFDTPDFSEQLFSNFGMSIKNKEYADTANQFYEEINVIEKVIVEIKLPGMLKLNANTQRAVAMKVWDAYAIPWRFCNHEICVIRSPQDLFGSPIIHSYPTSYFLSKIAKILDDGNDQFF
jgi:hypothetical protein